MSGTLWGEIWGLSFAVAHSDKTIGKCLENAVGISFSIILFENLLGWSIPTINVRKNANVRNPT